ncbi:HU family DNA-binding protein [Rhodovulum steppense]|uniref:HU family DNA-binding protein n=1 Tax=Rhodovulum steppense TaxID=540251 RepID=A0A4R1YV83_9RHOB|nr:HU family DNA-binding protein [Rhodovulum steppense]TCM84807.1 HU family DNA-binding protein [Rhodovulum steppense]
MGTVNKTDLARELSELTGLTRQAATEAIEMLFAAVKTHAVAGDTVSIPGFGRFQVKARAARTGRNPMTGEPIQIPETRKLVFKPARPAT